MSDEGSERPPGGKGVGPDDPRYEDQRSTPPESSSDREEPIREVHLSVNISPEAYEALVRMAKDQGKTIPRMLRDAIAVANAVHEVLRAGGRVLARGRGRRTYELVLSWFGEPGREQSLTETIRRR
jgi:hypothetical protein